MPSILSDDDKQTVKRTVPKASNKIHAVAVAKLYIAHPNRNRWTYTGLQGAAVLADDLVGNTFWIKIVDVSPGNRGVIWDQEIYDTFSYNQDRTFFHSFEGEECMFGLSFADEKEAKQFLKKVTEREKNANKNTQRKPFASGAMQSGGYNNPQPNASGGGGKSRFGGLFSLHRNTNQPSSGPVQSIIPPRGVELNHHAGTNSPAATNSRPGSSSGIDLSDPDVQAVLRELKGMGITEDQIEEHAGFIKSYLAQNKATAAVEAEKRERTSRAPPPPPPAADLSPQHTGSSGGKRGPPPAPPPSRRTAPGGVPTMQRPPSPSPSPPRPSSPPRPRFRAPPPIADAGKFAHQAAAPTLPGRDRSSSNATPGPPPPPRPPKTPLEDSNSHQSAPATRFAVPPPFEGNRVPPGPPPPPIRAAAAAAVVPPPPPPRENPAPSIATLPPPPPPRGIPPPAISSSVPPPPPPLPPSTSRPVPPAPNGSILPPPPPPLPPPNSTSAGPPPPPPLPPTSGGGPPPPPPPPPAMPPRNNDSAAPPLPKAAEAGRGGLLADIRGGAKLRKVADTEKRDRSAAQVPGADNAGSSNAANTSTSTAGAPSGDAQGGLAGALASALAARKSKVSHSDDEKDDDDW